MGYDICAGKSRKLMDESYDNYLTHIQCQYSYKELLNESFGFEFTNFRGRISRAKKELFINGIDNMIEKLKDNSNHKPIFRGYIGATTPNNFINDLVDLRELIRTEEVKYLSVG